jgi:hypothetical protein
MTSIFLSYARSDDELFVSRLYHDLVAHGFEVWWDRISLPNRKLIFNPEIHDAITNCDFFVLVAGPRAFTSDYVVQEWKMALETGKEMYSLIRLKRIYGQREEYVTDFIPAEFKVPYDFSEDYFYQEHLIDLMKELSKPVVSCNKTDAIPTSPIHYSPPPKQLQQLRITQFFSNPREFLFDSYPAILI